VTSDTTPPTVGVAAPASGASVFGVVSISASASDNVGVAGVQFLLDGAAIGAEDTAAPFSLSWNTGSVVNGPHAITAVARDPAGNTTTSAPVSVTVSNSGPSGLVAAYGFNEGAGTTAGDASGLGNTGTLSGATWSAAGKFGGALSFNGTNAILNVLDSNSLDLTTGMTIEAWVRPTSQSGYRTVVMKDVPGELAYTLYSSGGGTAPSAWVRTGGTSKDSTGSSALALNAWSHLAATYNGASLVLYVNGAVVANKAVSGSIQTSANPFHIGGNAVWGEYFAGLIDEVRVYSRALTAAEIQTDMNAAVGSAAVTLAATGPILAVPTTSIAGDSVAEPATALVSTRKRGSVRALYLGTVPSSGALPS
jgi:hypothetical protein